MIAQNTLELRRPTGQLLSIIMSNYKLKQMIEEQFLDEKRGTMYEEDLFQTNLILKPVMNQPKFYEQEFLNKIGTDQKILIYQKQIWELTLYVIKNQKTFQAKFNYKDLQKISKLMKLGLQNSYNKSKISGIEKISKPKFNLEERNQFSKTDLNFNKQKLEKKTSIFTSKKLKVFDKATNSFKGKEFTEDYAVEKAERYLQNNANFSNRQSANNLKFLDSGEHTNGPTISYMFDGSMNSNLKLRRTVSDSSFFESTHRSHLKISDAFKTKKKKKNSDKIMMVDEKEKIRDRMFNNSYLKTYFKIQDERAIKKMALNEDQIEMSIESKEEHESMMRITNEHFFNTKQQSKFWVLFVKSLNISDKYDKEHRMRIRLESDNLCYQKRLRQQIFNDEIFYLEKLKLIDQKLVFKNVRVFLNPRKIVFDNIFGNFSNFALVRDSTRYNASDYDIQIYAFDYLSGEIAKSIIKMEKAIEQSGFQYQDVKNQRLMLSEVIQLAKLLIYDDQYNEGIANLRKHTTQDDLKYVPPQSNLVQKMLRQDYYENCMQQKNEVNQKRKELIDWKKNQAKREGKSIYSKVISLDSGGNKYQYLRLNLIPTPNNLLFRLYSQNLLIKIDERIPLIDISEKTQISLEILNQYSQYRRQKKRIYKRNFQFIEELSERILNAYVPQMTKNFLEKYNDEGDKNIQQAQFIILFKDDEKIQNQNQIQNDISITKTRLINLTIASRQATANNHQRQNSQSPSMKLIDSVQNSINKTNNKNKIFTLMNSTQKSETQLLGLPSMAKNKKKKKKKKKKKILKRNIQFDNVQQTNLDIEQF
ncbi:UNKNOWN [Stylonychia lemnae]|uniref:Uncharacterized protein n=1 Tax=Stylonychia lemnae TaxID=5949 RepID=A0A078ABR3_STYLE|nr:UNKNOWN [Stylonychia lemnae]|eukprot:CDW79027.1 UNKNOWN [Stylonychia lemnae]